MCRCKPLLRRAPLFHHSSAAGLCVETIKPNVSQTSLGSYRTARRNLKAPVNLLSWRYYPQSQNIMVIKQRLQHSY